MSMSAAARSGIVDAPAVAYVDPENPQNVYVRGVLPEWMKQKMAEQGYDPKAQSDREAFKKNYLIASPENPDTFALVSETAEEIAARNRPAQLPAIAPGTDLAAAPLDGEWISRESRLAILEREADGARMAFVHAHCTYGALLLEYRDLCAEDGQRFGAFVERQGLSARRAYELMSVAQGVRQFPALKDMAAGQYSKVLALIEGMGGDLGRLVEGQLDLTLDEVDKLSVRQLKDRVRLLTHEKDKIVAEEVKTLRSETDALREDLASARGALDGDVAQARKSARALREAVQTLADAADRLLDQLAPLPTGDLNRLRADLESSISSGSLRLKDLWTTLQERVLELGLDD